jgi:hypothetical protein
MRSKKIEYAILKLILKHPDTAGRGFTLPGLRNLVVQLVPDPSDSELVDAIIRLWGSRVIEVQKWNSDTGAFEAYDGSGDTEFFCQRDFRLKETPQTQPCFEQLEKDVGPEPERRPIGF